VGPEGEALGVEAKQLEYSRAGLDTGRALWTKQTGRSAGRGELARWMARKELDWMWQEANWEKSDRSRAGLDAVDKRSEYSLG
jgi:hypothetical protein